MGSLPRRTLGSLARHGALGSLAVALHYVGLRLARMRAFVGERWFDARHGVDTSGIMEHAQPHDPVYAHAVHYEPVLPRRFREAIDSVALGRSGFTFIDIGCGKGKGLLLAAMAGFTKLVGVELSPPLAETARSNLRRWASRHAALEFEVVEGNAAGYSFPPEPSVLLLYNPFHEEIMRPVLANLEATLRRHPRRVVILYVNPVLASLLDSMPLLRRSASGDGYVVYETVVNDGGRPGAAVPTTEA